MEWHYFTVIDTHTGLGRGFRWREGDLYASFLITAVREGV